MLNLTIDTTTKTLQASILLAGENAPIDVELKSYQLLEKDGRTFLLIDPQDVQTSRAWINTLAGQLLKTEPLEIPSQFAWLIKLLA